MKIAMCLSGQPRTWRKCYQSWFKNICPGYEVDIFFHMWDFNTLSMAALSKNFQPDTELTVEEKQEIIDTLKPKKFKFDNRKIIYTHDSKHLLTNEFVKDPVGWWCRSQYYSLWYAARLKRMYELENNFQYDMVIRNRPDAYWPVEFNLAHKIQPNTIYSYDNDWIEKWQTFIISDLFFYADSFTYDQISEFYYGLNYIDASHIKHGAKKLPHLPPPECALYTFIKSKGITNTYIGRWYNGEKALNIKTMRDEQYVQILGGIGSHEAL